jgi:hypothetical protein
LKTKIAVENVGLDAKLSKDFLFFKKIFFLKEKGAHCHSAAAAD